jgi:hypothetical protein
MISIFIKGTVSRTRWREKAMGCKPRHQLRIATGFKIDSDRPFNSCASLKFKVCLIKPRLSWPDLAPRRMPIWYLSCKECCVYRTLIAGYLAYWAPTLLASLTLIPLWDWRLKWLAHRKHWHPARQSFHTGWFLLVVALDSLHYWSNVSWST